MRPAVTSTASNSASATGEFAMRLAWLNNVCFTASQAACTAEPHDAAVQEPPSTGEVGKSESPMRAVTASIGRPNASAPICVRIVQVPVPMSEDAVATSNLPSAVSLAVASAFCMLASQTPVGTPPADPLAALPHGTGLVAAPVPAERGGALGVAGVQCFRGVLLILVLVFGGEVSPP